jgi:hypothetical protein
MEAKSVEGHDPGGFLTAMLQGMQAERRQRRRIRMTENAEDSALFVERVPIQFIETMRSRCMRNRLIHLEPRLPEKGKGRPGKRPGPSPIFTLMSRLGGL